MLPTTIKEKSIGSQIAEKIVSLAADTNKNHVLDEISIYGMSDKDGSATLAFEFLGETVKNTKISEEVYDFFKKIRSLLIMFGKEVVEQEFPRRELLQNATRIAYRIRIWDIDGKYEFFNREPVAK